MSLVTHSPRCTMTCRHLCALLGIDVEDSCVTTTPNSNELKSVKSHVASRSATKKNVCSTSEAEAGGAQTPRGGDNNASSDEVSKNEKIVTSLSTTSTLNGVTSLSTTSTLDAATSLSSVETLNVV